MNTQTITSSELHALKIVAKQADKQRKELPVGAHDMDFGVHIVGRLVVAANSEIAQPSAPKARELVAALLCKFGPRKRHQIADAIIEVGVFPSIDDPAALELADSVINALTVRSLVPRSGNVTGQFEIQPVRVK